MRRMLLVLLCHACADAPAALYGEVHVHGFAGGAHPGALFVAKAIPINETSGDSILPDPPPVATAGACGLAAPVSTPAAVRLIDGGVVRIIGGLGIHEVDLAFSPGGYLPTATLVGPVFQGGEQLVFRSTGAAARAFTGELTAPQPLILLQPAAPGLPNGDFLVAWVPDKATQVSLTLVVSRADGATAIVRCVAADRDGQVIVLSRMMSFLPARPRDVQLIASRDELATGHSDESGLGVKVHAGFESRLDWHEQ